MLLRVLFTLYIIINYTEKYNFMASYRFDISTAVVIKCSVFWDITSYSPFKAKRCFGKTCLRLLLFHAGFLLGLFFNHEDGDDMLSETSDDFQRTTRRYIQEYGTLLMVTCTGSLSLSGFKELQYSTIAEFVTVHKLQYRIHICFD
jgi:hypothetical protein